MVVNYYAPPFINTAKISSLAHLSAPTTSLALALCHSANRGTGAKSGWIRNESQRNP